MKGSPKLFPGPIAQVLGTVGPARRVLQHVMHACPVVPALAIFSGFVSSGLVRLFVTAGVHGMDDVPRQPEHVPIELRATFTSYINAVVVFVVERFPHVLFGNANEFVRIYVFRIASCYV